MNDPDFYVLVGMTIMNSLVLGFICFYLQRVKNTFEDINRFQENLCKRLEMEFENSFKKEECKEND